MISVSVVLDEENYEKTQTLMPGHLLWEHEDSCWIMLIDATTLIWRVL